MAIEITEISGFDTIAASRIVLNQNFSKLKKQLLKHLKQMQKRKPTNNLVVSKIYSILDI